MFFQIPLVTALAASSLASASTLRRARQHDHGHGTPDPEFCSGGCTDVHDPNIIRKDGLYYRFTSFHNIAIATAESLSGPWEYQGALLEDGTMIQVTEDQNIWGPNVQKVGDTFYAYYSVSKMGFQGSDIGVATSSTLDPGSWTDHGSVGLPMSSFYNLIDPSLLQSGDTNYLTFGSYWHGIYQTTLPDPPLMYDNEEPWNLAYNSSVNAAVWEAAFIFQWEGWFFLFYSAGECCRQPPDLAAPGDEYRIQVCRSSSTTGPYYDRSGRDCVTENGGTLVIGSHGDVYAPGGQGIIVDEESGWPLIYYHYRSLTRDCS
ncbi:endo-1,5-alpha-L-arabinosidase [Delitschia confertaspora ATCC 74209]|uniref:Arabinan endo-1,5-alpha-L-arabinosidase n=1 Tax=Delitschia confertaspora ATCC 74209 TaxID=1513339 RepID=A0A9P4JUT8_9PLEO|nr:endo-1,5-alpha-L-arabinosidase [Delitschia confertaspora ATCC 74209]